MDYTALKNLRTSDFEMASRGYRATSDMANAANEALERRIAVKMRESLSGVAAKAALHQLRELAKDFHYTQVECGVISTALNALASDLQTAKKKLDAAVADAEGEKLTVGTDGSVTYPAGGDKYQGKTPPGGTVNGVTDKTAKALHRQAARFHPNPHYARAQEYADRIAVALEEATEADEKWAPKLRKLRADDDLTVSAADWVDAQKDTGGVRDGADHYLDGIKTPPKDGDPEDNAEWWKHLSADQRDAYIALHPASIGAMNGLPADARDEANRTVLAETRGQHEMKLNAIPKEPSPQFVPIGARGDMTYSQEWLDWHGKYSERKEYLEEKLKGMRAIQDRFDRTGENGLPEAYLLGFDPDGEGNGRIILANGNPDTADHTAIYVPGTTTDISTIGEDSGDTPSDLKRSESLWNESVRLAPGQKISTITWLDYDAPDIIPEATSDRYAEQGAPILHHFLEGNRTAHQYASGETGHTTVIGHSYGSTLIGDTAKTAGWNETPVPADDVLVAGSPGMQADHAADLGIDPKHMWAMGGGSDDFIVRHGGYLSGLGDNLVIPTDPEFGGNIMTSDAGGHGAFWDTEGGQASLSLKNQARVVVARYGDVTLDSKAHW
ncbi:alpha/beta hydrolase family protein [Streptomyces sp. Isolate_219]|uniref:alpha/beta hydrolase family protein n=1 Tax=Streptomyces sp. Isolate_219 TaxID=2950110 RepID=UPI0021CA86A3|nr:alpha/beta hydrolase family protein [Streptomyces sp. Isolate_219]MCR8573594.1 alpha/beta hydrolase family protein [Streptomyces sp. Isolate_219]